MRIQVILVLLIGFISVITPGKAQEKSGNLKGVEYKIFTPNAGEKIKLNDVITFNLIQKTDKDSVLLSSYQMGYPFKVQVHQSKNIADLMEIFPLLSVKDSAMVKIPTDSIFSGNENQRPPFLPKGSSLVFLIKIEKAQSIDEVKAEEKAEMERLEASEKVTLEKYIFDNKLSPKVTTSGLRYIIVQPSSKAKPSSGDTALVNYIGRTLDGKVFDSSIEAEAKNAGLQQQGRKYEPISVVLGEGQVIRGWDEGLLLLNEGSKAKFLIPSPLGYGSRGAGSDIKPFSTLIFDVELVEVKPAKQEAKPATSVPAAKKTSVVKKTPAKSSTTIKKPIPAKKPTIKK